MAAFDPGIWNAVPQPQSFIDVARDLSGLRDARQRRQQNALLMERQAEDRDRENALLQFEQGLEGVAPEDLPDAYQRAGYVGRAEDLRNKQTERRRQAAALAAEEQRVAGSKRQFLLQGLTGITDRETAKQHLADGVQGGVFSMKEATRLMQAVPTDPAQFARWRDTLVLGADKVTDNDRQAGQAAETARHNRAMEDAARARAAAGGGGGDIRTQVVDTAEGPRLVYMEGPLAGQAVPITQGGKPLQSKQATTAASTAKKAQAFAGEANDRFDRIATNVQRMLASPALQGGDRPSNTLDVGTGLRGVIARRIPGSDAADLDSLRETVLANLGFKELADMRASSPTGGALGNITERELTFLQSSVASLREASSAPAIRQALQDILGSLERSRTRINAAAQEDGAAPRQSPADAARAAVSDRRATPLMPDTTELFNAADAILRGGR